MLVLFSFVANTHSRIQFFCDKPVYC